MSDGSLSQDEIDALLAGTGNIDLGDGADATSAPVAGQSFEGLKNTLSETVGQQQSNMSMITGGDVEFAPPTVNAGSPSGLSGNLVQIVYNLGDGGGHSYVMSDADALAFASASMGLDGIELDDAALNAVQEVFSQVSGPVVNILSEKTGMTLMPEPARAQSTTSTGLELPPSPVYARYTISIAERSAVVYELFDGSFVSRLDQQPAPQAAPAVGMAPPQAAAPMQGGFPMPGMAPPQMGGGMAQMGAGTSVQSVQFPNLQPQMGSSSQGNIGLLMDVYMEMTVELGRTKKLIKDILGMGEGTIIELDKLAGEPVDILVNHKLIAKGEVVVIDENFGVRVTEIVSPMERVSDVT